MKLSFIFLDLFLVFSLFAFEEDSPFGMNNSIIKDLIGTSQSSIKYRKKYKASMDSTTSIGIGWWRVQTSQGILRTGRGVFRWADIEPNKDSFDFSRTDSLVKWAGERGLHLLPIIGFTVPWAHHSTLSNSEKKYWHRYPPDPSYWGDYKEYVRELVERYDGDGEQDYEGLIIPIKYWECMNEPFNQYFLGTPEDYAKIFLMTRRAIRDADVNAKIIGPCLSCGPHGNLLKWRYYNTAEKSEKDIIFNRWEDAESLLVFNLIGLDSIDVISHHIYNSAHNFMEWTRDLRKIIGKDKPIWITESGYRSSDHLRVDCRWCKDCHVIYNATSNEPFFGSVSAKWDWDEPCYTFIDTFLKPGDAIILVDTTDWDKDTLIYRGGTLVQDDGDTALALGDTLEIFDRLNGNIIHTPESQAKEYETLLDSLICTQGFLENLKIFFFSMDPSIHDRYYPPRIRFDGMNPPIYIRQEIRAIHTIIDSSGVPLPAYYTILNKIKIYKKNK